MSGLAPPCPLGRSKAGGAPRPRDYDLVLRLRPDLLVWEPLPASVFDDSRNLYVVSRSTYVGGNEDNLAVGRAEVLLRHVQLALLLPELGVRFELRLVHVLLGALLPLPLPFCVHVLCQRAWPPPLPLLVLPSTAARVRERIMSRSDGEASGL